jgi:hypothetical protein
MTNPDESIDYLNRLEGPIVEALAAMEAGGLPHAIKVGEAFLAAAPPAKSTKSAAASPDLTELLRNVGPDELRDALRRDMARRHWSVSRSTRSRRHVPSGSSGHQIPGRMRWCGCSPG